MLHVANTHGNCWDGGRGFWSASQIGIGRFWSDTRAKLCWNKGSLNY